jgi:hypothetical protein
MNIKRILRNLWFWLGAGLLLAVTTLAIQNASHQAAIVPQTGGPVQAQSVPEAGAQKPTAVRPPRLRRMQQRRVWQVICRRMARAPSS